MTIPHKCERCKERPWAYLWSPDGLLGHEILVCGACYDELEGEDLDEVAQYEGAHDDCDVDQPHTHPGT